MAKEMVSALNIRKSFGGQPVLKGISCSVRQGEVLAIIGPSGSGKSTLLRCITQLEQIDGGSITICGEELAKEENGKAVYADRKTCVRIGLHLGLVFQNFNLFPHFSVLRNITEAPMRVLKKSREEAEQTARTLLDKMGLSDKADAYPCQLSGGQQQRVSIARALLRRTPVLLADEATASLDRETAFRVTSSLLDLDGLTRIIVTHSLDEPLLSRFDEILVLRGGRIAEHGSFSSLMARKSYFFSLFTLSQPS